MSVQITIESNSVRFQEMETDAKGDLRVTFIFARRKGNQGSVVWRTLLFKNDSFPNWPKAKCWAGFQKSATELVQKKLQKLEDAKKEEMHAET